MECLPLMMQAEDRPEMDQGVEPPALQEQYRTAIRNTDNDSHETPVVGAFNAAINRRNPSEISDLITEDLTFVDSAGRIVSRRKNMTAQTISPISGKDYLLVVAAKGGLSIKPVPSG
jgi:hypothetical protein